MAWEIRNVGWPVPYGDTWPVTQRQSKSAEVTYLFSHRDQLYIQPYGYTYYSTETHKGSIINYWS